MKASQTLSFLALTQNYRPPVRWGGGFHRKAAWLQMRVPALTSDSGSTLGFPTSPCTQPSEAQAADREPKVRGHSALHRATQPVRGEPRSRVNSSLLPPSSHGEAGGVRAPGRDSELSDASCAFSLTPFNTQGGDALFHLGISFQTLPLQSDTNQCTAETLSVTSLPFHIANCLSF